MAPRYYSTEDDELIQLNYGRIPTRELSAILRRGETAVRHRASTLKVYAGSDAMRSDHWSDEHINLIKELAGEESWAAIGEMVGRSRVAVQSKARVLGLRGLQRPGDPRRNDYGRLFWNRTKWEALDRDGYCCQEPDCEVSCHDWAVLKIRQSPLKVHHIIPWRLSTDSSLKNLVVVCRRHHNSQKAHFWSTPATHELPLYQQLILAS
jgi:hypothetical protein